MGPFQRASTWASSVHWAPQIGNFIPLRVNRHTFRHDVPGRTSVNQECVKLHVAIRLPTDATVYFVYLFPLFLPYMFRALISPSSGVSQAQPFGSCSVYVAHLRVPVDWFIVVVSLYISPSSEVSQAVFFIYTTIWFMQCLCCSSACACGLVCCGGFTALVPWHQYSETTTTNQSTGTRRWAT